MAAPAVGVDGLQVAGGSEGAGLQLDEVGERGKNKRDLSIAGMYIHLTDICACYFFRLTPQLWTKSGRSFPKRSKTRRPLLDLARGSSLRRLMISHAGALLFRSR